MRHIGAVGQNLAASSIAQTMLGTMGERCNIEGLQVAKPPTQCQPDDGAISMATLAANGAYQVHLSVGFASTASASLPETASGYTVGDEQVPLVPTLTGSRESPQPPGDSA